jgi:RNA polymerase sigma-70 factor, ECF subfamily
MSRNNEDNISSLCADGEVKAFDLMVETYGTRLYRFIRSMTNGDAVANDIMQETFLRVYKNMVIRGQGDNPGAFLHKIAYNLCLNGSRTEKRRYGIERKYFESESALGTDGPGNAESEILKNERAETVRNAVMRLPEKQRTAIALFNWSGMKISEIAVIMDCSEGTVTSHLHRARTTLKEQLKELL